MTEEFLIFAKPTITDATPKSFVIFNSSLRIGQTLDVAVRGKFLVNLKNVYLSASDVNMFDGIIQFNPFISTPQSSYNPPFTALLIPNFSYTENYIIFKVSQLFKTSGFFDILVENDAGYGKLTTGSLVPFISAYSDALDIQSTCISGIKVTLY
jgi:hypothetical protein